MSVNMCHISQGPIIFVPDVMSLLLVRRSVDGTATHADLICNTVWLKGLLGDVRMEGCMEVRKRICS